MLICVHVLGEGFIINISRATTFYFSERLGEVVIVCMCLSCFSSFIFTGL